MEGGTHGQGHRYRSRHHEFVRGGHGGRRAQGDRERGGVPHHAVGGGVLQDRRAAGGSGRAPSGGDQPEEHDLLDQAVHGPQVRRGRRARSSSCPTRSCAGTERRRARARRRPGVLAARDLGDDPAEDAADRGGLPGREGDRGGRHGARVLQRQPAPGDQGRRPHRGARRQAHHQRADRGARSPTVSTRRRTRRSPCSTWAAARSTSRSSRSATACSRCGRPTATPTWAATTSTSG